jgi:hypothetical protein
LIHDLLVSVGVESLPAAARKAWLGLRDELRAILGEDLVAIWAYGSVIGSDRPKRPADLDTHVIVRRAPDATTAEGIQDAIAGLGEVEFDAWFVTLDDARRAGWPPHAFLEGRRDTSWAVHRAHWLAGRVITLHGPSPRDIVPPPSWPELRADLDRELEHIERHIREGDTDPYEAAYALLNGSRILRSLETEDVVLSKREAGAWALESLPDRWHPALHAALRAYDQQETPQDAALLAAEMAPFVAMVREHLPTADSRSSKEPRWSGY